MNKRPTMLSATFARSAETVLAIHAVNRKPGSRSEEQWRTSLRDYAPPRLGGAATVYARKELNRVEESDVRLPSGVVGAVQGMSYQVEPLGGNSLLDPETLACIAGFADRVW